MRALINWGFWINVIRNVDDDDHEHIRSERVEHFLREFGRFVVSRDDHNVAVSLGQRSPSPSFGLGVTIEVLMDGVLQFASGAQLAAVAPS